MLAVHEALRLVLDHTSRLEPRRLPVAEALGLILAEEVVSDVDLPPFDRASMDGFAVRSRDTEAPPRSLKIVGEVAAGDDPRFELGEGEAAAISTGAPLPEGADAVQPIEKVRVEGQRVNLFETIEPGRHVAARGRELAKGSAALERETTLGPAAVGVLAMVGRTEVVVHPRARVGIIGTGSELVEPSETPGAGQIRNSNSSMLEAAVRALGAEPEILGIAPDDRRSLGRLIKKGLRSDALLLTGGVSVGEHDLVEEALARHDVKIHFDSVAVKPGKPVTFGTHDGGLVFGLPGNPVSALATFHLFAAPALRRLMGLPNASGVRLRAALRGGFTRKADRMGALPAWVQHEEKGWTVRRLKTEGSADLASTTRANALLLCPVEQESLEEGALMEVLLLPSFETY